LVDPSSQAKSFSLFVMKLSFYCRCVVRFQLPPA